MSGRLLHAGVLSAVLLSMLGWVVIEKVQRWLDRRGCVGLDLDEPEETEFIRALKSPRVVAEGEAAATRGNPRRGDR